MRAKRRPGDVTGLVFGVAGLALNGWVYVRLHEVLALAMVVLLLVFMGLHVRAMVRNSRR